MNEPEIHQALVRDLKYPLYGKYYISRLIEEDREITDTIQYITEYEYLHSDGVWRYSTANEVGEFTGYYDTLLDAEATLNEFG